MASDLQRAQALVEEALALVGENGLRKVVTNIARQQLTGAMLLVHQDSWWVAQFMEMFNNPSSVNFPALIKLLDKLIPNPAADRIEKVEAETFIVQYERPIEGAEH